MKKVVLTIIGFAIAIALVVGVIIPLANHGRNTGTAANTNFNSVDTNIGNLDTPIN